MCVRSYLRLLLNGCKKFFPRFVAFWNGDNILGGLYILEGSENEFYAGKHFMSAYTIGKLQI